MLDDLALTIAKMAAKVPGGILIFFPSYKLMNDIYERWFRSGNLKEIQQFKQVYREPSNAEEY
jgi:Rad3-related DNA helicase